MKQTAVEFLHFQFNALLLAKDELLKENKFFQIFDSIINEAKQIEKEQIIDAFNSGMNHSVDYFIQSGDTTEATEYYKETFKQ